MNRHERPPSPGGAALETYEDLVAVAHSVSDEHITRRLHDLLAAELAGSLPDLERHWQSAGGFPASARQKDEVREVAAELEAAKRELWRVQQELQRVLERRQYVQFTLAVADTRLALMREQFTDRGMAPHLASARVQARKILDDAHASANDIIAEARTLADWLIGQAQAERGKALTVRPSCHKGG